MKITGNTIYEHNKHGEVLVIDVHHVFDEYDLNAGTGELHSRVVQYTPNWDDYGPMPGSIRETSIDGEVVRERFKFIKCENHLGGDA